MKQEKIALGLLVVIIVAILGLYIVSNEGVFDNLFVSEKEIELGDCADINYIGRYTGDGVFGFSYGDLTNKTGGTPLEIYVNYNTSSSPPEGYGNYSNNIVMSYGEYYNKALIDGLIGLKEGDTATIGPIPADSANGVSPEIGDEMNLTAYAGQPYIYSFYDIQRNVTMPAEYQEVYGDITTNLYILRNEMHYVGEIIATDYTFWTNSTEVTKMNETHIWKYTTPKTSVGETFTYLWEGIDEDIGAQVQLVYPTNSSYISSYNDSTIVVTHDPTIDSNITLNAYNQMWSSYTPYSTYTVKNITGDKINTSYVDPMTSNTSYKLFNRTTTITRNQTESILQPEIPGEFLEYLMFSYFRSIDSDFKFGYNPFTESSTFEVEIVKIYKTSEES